MKIIKWQFQVCIKVLPKNISRIGSLGIDTLALDCYDDFPFHHIILGAGKIIIENIGQELEKLPPVGAYMSAY